MLTAAVLATVVMAAGPARPLLRLPEAVREISAPLGRLGSVVEGLPQGGMNSSDKPVLLRIAGCQAQQVVYLMRMVGGTARAVEQTQQWLDAMPGFEAKLFKRKGVLSEVMRQLGDATFETQKACTRLSLRDGYQLEVERAPTNYCPSEDTKRNGLGDHWFFTKSKAAAVVNVQSGGESDVCKPRLSAVLFDALGTARVRLHADWGGEAMMSLVGDGCQVVDFVLNKETQTFAPTVRSCKR